VQPGARVVPSVDTGRMSVLGRFMTCPPARRIETR
jgi:hypothetical protein